MSLDLLKNTRLPLTKRERKIVNGNLISYALEDALNKRTVTTKGGSYYCCAKLIKRILGINYYKKPIFKIMCWSVDPDYCCGKCHLDNSLTGNIKGKRTGYCNDDCCKVRKIKSSKKFTLIWE